MYGGMDQMMYQNYDGSAGMNQFQNSSYPPNGMMQGNGMMMQNMYSNGGMENMSPNPLMSGGHQSPKKVTKEDKGSVRYQGTVKSFSPSNGYGFLSVHQGSFKQDIFLHQAEVDRATGQAKSVLPNGTCVSFTVLNNKRGQPQAREVQIVEGNSFSNSHGPSSGMGNSMLGQGQDHPGNNMGFNPYSTYSGMGQQQMYMPHGNF